MLHKPVEAIVEHIRLSCKVSLLEKMVERLTRLEGLQNEGQEARVGTHLYITDVPALLSSARNMHFTT